MKMEQIFREFERALENEYYMELAKKEVMTVPLLIEVFLDDDYANSLWAEQLSCMEHMENTCKAFAC